MTSPPRDPPASTGQPARTTALLTAAGRIHSPAPPPPHVRIQGADPFSHGKTEPNGAGIQACWPTTSKAAADSSNQRRRSVPIANEDRLVVTDTLGTTIKSTSEVFQEHAGPHRAGRCREQNIRPVVTAWSGMRRSPNSSFRVSGPAAATWLH